MKALAILGVILVVVGIVGLAMGGFSFTTREQVAKLGPIEATAEKQHDFPIPPVASLVALVAGGALVFAGLRRR